MLRASVPIFLVTVSALLHFSAAAGTTAAPHWSYHADNTDEIPPQAWESLYPTCKGSRESPIAIDARTVFTDSNLNALKLSSSKPIGEQWTVVNNGHSVQFSGTFQNPAEISGGGLGDEYVFTQFHFHWGANDARGSEHIVNQRRYPLELHIVHQKKSDTAATVGSDSTGMAVVSILFELAPAGHTHLNMLLAAVMKVADTPGTPINITLKSLSLAALQPSSPNYYRYNGSLTTPPCSEAVVWTVMEEPQKVTETQLQMFRRLRENVGQLATIADNDRPVQALAGRKVTQYKPQPVQAKTGPKRVGRRFPVRRQR